MQEIETKRMQEVDVIVVGGGVAGVVAAVVAALCVKARCSNYKLDVKMLQAVLKEAGVKIQFG